MWTTVNFYIRVDDRPTSSGYGLPLSLHRWLEKPGDIRLERWDIEKKRWVPSPSLIDAIGAGGADDFVDIDEDEAAGILTNWGGDPKTLYGDDVEGSPRDTSSDPDRPGGQPKSKPKPRG